jgi:Uma2 family endonuclease
MSNGRYAQDLYPLGMVSAQLGDVLPGQRACRVIVWPGCVIMSTVLRTRLTYEDYRLIPDDGRRYELLEGQLHVTPAPSLEHQHVSKRLFTILLRYFEEGGRGAVFYAPLDVILAKDDVVQPDLVVVRDPAQLSSRGIEGAPFLLVEVISPGRAHYDRTVKAQRYAAHGVPHYWIVDPEARRLECFRLGEGHYALQAAGTGNDVVEVPDLPALGIPLATLWFGRASTPSGK